MKYIVTTYEKTCSLTTSGTVVIKRSVEVEASSIEDAFIDVLALHPCRRSIISLQVKESECVIQADGGKLYAKNV